jgi:hypothetical protein
MDPRVRQTIIHQLKSFNTVERKGICRVKKIVFKMEAKQIMIILDQIYIFLNAWQIL